MDSGNLLPWQLKKIAASIRPATAYLLRLEQRMRDTGFPADDPLFRRVCEALAGLRAMGMEIQHRQFQEPPDLGEKTH